MASKLGWSWTNGAGLIRGNPNILGLVEHYARGHVGWTAFVHVAGWPRCGITKIQGRARTVADAKTQAERAAKLLGKAVRRG